jgi:hypothetical protein
MKQPDQGIGSSSHRSEHVQLRLIGKDEYRKGVVHASVPFQNADADELIAIGGSGSRAANAALRVLGGVCRLHRTANGRLC